MTTDEDPQWAAAITAVYTRDLNALRQSVSAAPQLLARRDPEGRTLLLNACFPLLSVACKAVVEALLDMGADPKCVDMNGMTGLHGIAMAHTQKRPQDPDLIRLLVARGAPLEAQDKWGNTALWRAAFGLKPGCTRSIVDVLVECGASVDCANHSGVTPRKLLDAS